MSSASVLDHVSTRGRLQFEAPRFVPDYQQRTPRGTEIVPRGYGGADVTSANMLFGTFAPTPVPKLPSAASVKIGLVRSRQRGPIISLADVMKVHIDEVRMHFWLSKPTLAAKATLFKAKQMETVTRPIPIEEIINAQADEILSEVYRLDHKDVQAASYVVYDRLEDMLYKGSYDLCDRILRRVTLSKISTTVMRSLLTITWESRQNLTARASLFSRIESEMIRIRGAETTKRLLGKLS